MNTNNSTLPVGTILKRKYKIQSHLSSGGFGHTYLAVYGSPKTKVAIKEFFMRTANKREADGVSVSVDNNSEDAKNFRSQFEKFKKEAERLREISNPYVVKVHDLFEENGTVYYVMDFIKGYDIESRLKQRGKPYAEKTVFTILHRILNALSAIHSNGLLHLDLKPSNIMMTQHGYIKLIDLGASKEYTSGQGATMFSGFAMTRAYAAPEQIDGTYNKFGPWTDFYALGATLYRMLTYQEPPSLTELSEDSTEDKSRALPMPNVSAKMKQLVVCMMQLNRTKRPQSTREILDFLEANNFVHTAASSKAKYSNAFSDTNNETEDETIVTEQPKLSVGKSHLIFDKDKNRQYVTVGTNSDWDVACASTWIKITKFNASIRVSVCKNYGNNDRIGVIRISAGNLVRTIDVVQKGNVAERHINSNTPSPTKEEDEEFSFVGCIYMIAIAIVLALIIKFILL